ncbi:MAG TPA: FMN-binding glutamate synthase family protein [Firmicutes bacterium]|nr:FMN-binding glutamate synthase family protein [Bacillota bacterium]
MVDAFPAGDHRRVRRRSAPQADEGQVHGQSPDDGLRAEAGLLPEEREAADKLIGQFNRGGYLNSPNKYRQLDAIEIQLGQGAQGAAPQRTQAKFIDARMREVFELEEGRPAVLHSRIPGVNGAADLRDLVHRLKDETPAPVGVKLGASHFLEEELQIAVDAGVDFVTVDGAEGGTHGSSPTLLDDLGLPTIFATARARRFLDQHKLRGRVSLLAGGGLFTPGHFLKALALGADAVYVGTAAILALVAQQVNRVSPTEPPAQMILESGRLKDRFDVDLGTAGVVNFLSVAVEEMKAVMYALGKAAVSQLNAEDLVCLDPWLARALRVQYAGVSPAEQEAFYRGLPAGEWVSPARQPEPVSVP